MSNEEFNPEPDNQANEEQGTNIDIGPGQEQHLPHEAWHVVQQKQQRVRPRPIPDDGEVEGAE